ncbi:MAG: Cyclic di-GMP phosphodiesterase response regulator RpfG [Firmicutes bacterium ADurb.Bin456]|nr:MAG: Cyclic di-GMP phosphodiesterase response regulator RpfG [Firmicutes bacterium ADurb.Bin456]
MEIQHKWTGLIDPSYYPGLAAVALIVLAITLVFLNIFRKNAVEMRYRERLWPRLIAVFNKTNSFEQTFSDLLVIIAEVIQAPGYYFYTVAAKGEDLILRAARSTSTCKQIGPDYAGLVPHQREIYSPPVGIPVASQPVSTALVKEGGADMIFVPLNAGEGGQNPIGLITIGPVKKPGKKELERLTGISRGLAPYVKVVAEYYQMREKEQSIQAASCAAAKVARSAIDSKEVINTFFGLALKLADALGGVIMTRKDKELQLETAAPEKFKEATLQMFLKDTSVQRTFYKVSAAKEVNLFQPGMPEYCLLPSYLTDKEVGSTALFSVKIKDAPGFAAFFIKKGAVMEPHRLGAMELIIQRIGDVINNQWVFEEASRSYLAVLKTLVTAIDAREPYYVGHSGRIARYAGAIARELGLLQEAGNIELAGFLHDVGMISLGEDVYLKQGRFSESDYEAMKLHVDVGAKMVESLGLPGDIASCIRHHHERWDGWGYPSGLKGEEIPVGARIITVADVFNAKVSNRSYRPALDFDRGLADIKAAAGSQLDPLAVRAFLDLIKRKRVSAANREGSLEPCWEMKSCPKALAATCPAYHNGKNCWQTGGVKCASHGDTCSNCFVYTEYRGRQNRYALNLID